MFLKVFLIDKLYNEGTQRSLDRTMKRMLLVMSMILFAMSGCINAKPLDIEERLAHEFYKPKDEGYLKEMVGVTYELSNDGVFTISHKGSYDLSKDIIKVKSCEVIASTMEAAEDSNCSRKELEKASQISEALNIELGRLDVSKEELLEFLMKE